MQKVVIDSSYFNFYRFYATLSWYKRDEDRVKMYAGVPLLENEVFMTTFEKMWLKTVFDICRYFRVEKSDLIFARDGANVWRYNIYREYKAGRSTPTDGPEAPGPIFNHANTHFHPRITKNVYRIDHLEGDDLIALIARDIKSDERLAILTGDKDLLQLCAPNIKVYKLGGSKVCTEMTVPDPQAFLLEKILQGDPSDNIPPVFKGCGKATAAKMAQDPEFFKKKIAGHMAQYELNKRLIDLTQIPEYTTINIYESR